MRYVWLVRDYTDYQQGDSVDVFSTLDKAKEYADKMAQWENIALDAKHKPTEDKPFSWRYDGGGIDIERVEQDPALPERVVRELAARD